MKVEQQGSYYDVIIIQKLHWDMFPKTLLQNQYIHLLALPITPDFNREIVNFMCHFYCYDLTALVRNVSPNDQSYA